MNFAKFLRTRRGVEYLCVTVFISTLYFLCVTGFISMQYFLQSKYSIEIEQNIGFEWVKVSSEFSQSFYKKFTD